VSTSQWRKGLFFAGINAFILVSPQNTNTLEIGIFSSSSKKNTHCNFDF